MGTPKAALALGGGRETVLGRVIWTLQTGGIADVSVVAGAHVEAVRSAIPAEGRVRVIEHPGWRNGQLSSLLAGLEAVDDQHVEALMVTLVDVPLVTPSTVAAVAEQWRRTRAPIVRPARGERHGHPVIFDRRVFADLRAADVSVGAKAVFAIHREQIVNVEVADPGAFEDIDTPEDYERLLDRGSRAE